jgi:hypothetical protein
MTLTAMLHMNIRMSQGIKEGRTLCGQGVESASPGETFENVSPGGIFPSQTSILLTA